VMPCCTARAARICFRVSSGCLATRNLGVAAATIAPANSGGRGDGPVTCLQIIVLAGGTFVYRGRKSLTTDLTQQR
jgi:hypothetical protein